MGDKGWPGKSLMGMNTHMQYYGDEHTRIECMERKAWRWTHTYKRMEGGESRVEDPKIAA